MDEIWDVIVVGAGIVGSSAAYHCVKQGLKTLLIEQVGESVGVWVWWEQG